jgi:2-oxoacid:acceptor oxidoreductase gamma subunit (pyruvate/2-ketoisovalerate family)
MVEIRIHGRGGQGAVVACKLLAEAVFQEGKFCQSFPAFGVERRGAPVAAFTRIDDKPITLRCEIYEPDHLVVLDPTLIGPVNVVAGLKPGGTVLINSDRPPGFFKLPGSYKVVTVDAAHIAVKNRLGTKSTPIVNTAILGSFAKITGLVKLESILAAIEKGVPVKAENNKAAAREAYDTV